MRKITESIVSAFLNRQRKSNGNTTTDGDSLYLHGHEIARHGYANGAQSFEGGTRGIYISLAGWNTTTTRDRLKGVLTLLQAETTCLPFVGIWTKAGQTYVGIVTGKKGEATEIGGHDWLFIAITHDGLQVYPAMRHVATNSLVVAVGGAPFIVEVKPRSARDCWEITMSDGTVHTVEGVATAGCARAKFAEAVA